MRGHATQPIDPSSTSELPYRLACLCDLRDQRGRILMLDRVRSPNRGLSSPIGGKLDTLSGESPAECAQREIEEEALIRIPLSRLHFGGIISERAFEGRGHWLMFYFRVLGAVTVEEREMEEGTLRWHSPEELDSLPLPETDRQVIWPLIKACEPVQGTDDRPGFFSAHIDCRGDDISWTADQLLPAGPGLVRPVMPPSPTPG